MQRKIKRKLLPRRWIDLRTKGSHKHMEATLKRLCYHRCLSRSEESKCIRTHCKYPYFGTYLSTWIKLLHWVLKIFLELCLVCLCVKMPTLFLLSPLGPRFTADIGLSMTQFTVLRPLLSNISEYVYVIRRIYQR